MSTTITGHVGSRGTIVLAAESRRRYGLDDGSLFIQEERPEGILIRPAHAVPRDLSDVRAKIHEGIEAMRAGDVITEAESQQRIAKLRENALRRKK
jgi:bifunctional DNA-binding transcriptional regulator/antitoxin component of YhaV-PrlF toxin-antitoxin module